MICTKWKICTTDCHPLFSFMQSSTHLDLYLHLYNGSYDGEDHMVGGPGSRLPGLEWHVDVAVLDQCQTAELGSAKGHLALLWWDSHSEGN